MLQHLQADVQRNRIADSAAMAYVDHGEASLGRRSACAPCCIECSDCGAPAQAFIQAGRSHLGHGWDEWSWSLRCAGPSVYQRCIASTLSAPAACPDARHAYVPTTAHARICKRCARQHRCAHARGVCVRIRYDEYYECVCRIATTYTGHVLGGDAAGAATVPPQLLWCVQA